jgi:enterochelin esterase-like enzyme
MHAAIAVALLLVTLPAAASDEAPRNEIEAGYQTIAKAIESKDTAGVEAVLAGSFEYVPAEGRAISRPQWLQAWSRNFQDVEAYTAAWYEVRSVAAVRAGLCRAVVERTVFFRPAGARQESVQVCRTEDEWALGGGRWLLRSQRELNFPDDGETAAGERPLESERLRRLRAELDNVGAHAVDDFFDALRGHAPLIEKAGSDAGRRLVTFVYRGDPAVREVRMAGGPYRDGQKGLSRLDKTDLWYRTEILPSDARFVYFFTVTRPIQKRRADGRAGDEVVVTLPTNDPLNPIQFNGGSVVWPAEGPPPPHSNERPAPLRGTLHEHTIKSEALGGEERSFSVYTPPSSEHPPCLLVALDGEDYTGLIPTPSILDGLIAGGRLPPTVAVFVNQQGQRFRDLRCSPAFTKFLATELVPWVRAEYRATDRADRTVIAGASLGGLTAAFAGESYPRVFGKVLSQSGAFWYHPDAGQDGWLAARFAEAGRRPVEFWMEVGAFESPSMISNNRRLRDVLRAKGYPVRYREFNGGHDFLTWRDSLATGLVHLLGTQTDHAER